MTDGMRKLLDRLCDHATWAEGNLISDLRFVVDLIKSLATELEQVKQECDGLSIMLTSATSAAETYKRERDTAVKDLHLWGCFSCKHAGYAHSEICASCVYNRNRIVKGYVSGKNRYEWRGAKMDLEKE